jgi:hypothetical protein
MKSDTSSGFPAAPRIWSDTAFEAEEARLKAVRSLSPAVRLQQALDLSAERTTS